MGEIITISGPSGAGKTTLMNYLLLGRHYRVLESVTTRPPRERDLPNEFLYLAHEEFNQMEHEGKFLWVTKPIHGTRYGTLRESVEKALAGSDMSIMIITIECLSLLRFFAAKDAHKIFGVYIESPGEETLRSRLTLRGDAADEIEERINDCRDWDKIAKTIVDRLPIRFLQNTDSMKKFLAKAELILPL